MTKREQIDKLKMELEVLRVDNAFRRGKEEALLEAIERLGRKQEWVERREYIPYYPWYPYRPRDWYEPYPWYPYSSGPWTITCDNTTGVGYCQITDSNGVQVAPLEYQSTPTGEF